MRNDRQRPGKQPSGADASNRTANDEHGRGWCHGADETTDLKDGEED
jgi:hypothetical protein